MRVIYDIREQVPPNDFPAKVIGVFASLVFLIAFILVLTRIILCLNGRIQSSKISIILDFSGLVFIPIIAAMFISMGVNANKEYTENCKILNEDTCQCITGSPTITRTYQPNGFDGECVEFIINGVEFDTYELYQSETNGFSEEQITALRDAKSLTIKYYYTNIVNTILYIEVNS